MSQSPPEVSEGSSATANIIRSGISQQVSSGMTVRKAPVNSNHTGVPAVMQRIQLKNVAFIPGKAPSPSGHIS